MRAALVAVTCAACGSSQGHGMQDGVYLFAGDTDPAAGAVAISHRADGHVIDTQQADAVGHVAIGIEPDALITAVFTADSGSSGNPGDPPPTVYLVTAPVPAGDVELDIHGPPLPPSPPTVAGVLDIQPGSDLGATSYEIELGCTTTMVTKMPTSLDVNSHCLGSDSNLDVLVRGFAGGQLLGYAATRVGLDTGAATFAFPTWSTTTTDVPITLTGFAPTLDWQLEADGLPFDAQPIAGTAPLWTGLAVDAATVHATIATAAGAQITTLEIAGAPTAIAFTPDDFLPPITPTLALSAPGMTLAWTPAGLDAVADALDLHLEWDAGGYHVAWDFVGSSAASAAVFPAGSANGIDLATLIAPAGTPPDATLRYVGGTTPIGWDALEASGLYVEATAGTSSIAPLPASGELRATAATGYAR